MIKMKKKPSPTPESFSIMSLPDDLQLSCLARVPRLYYPTLSLVSKRFRSLVYSLELYKVRSPVSHSESYLYVCIGSSWDQNAKWFTLCHDSPNKTLTNDTGYFLTNVPIPGTICADFSNFVAVGSDIYKIGESPTYNRDKPSSTVSILDCTSHTWREGPRLPVELLSLTASVIDRKIYVAGCGTFGSVEPNLFHVLDTTTQIWDLEPTPCHEARKAFYRSKSACVDGKFHVKSFNEEVAYNPKEGRWDTVGRPGVGNYLSTDAYCEIGNILFCVHSGVIGWYDTKESEWRRVEGLVGFHEFSPENYVRLADYGGKIAVLWEEMSTIFSNATSTIWCAVIELERRKSCEIWGKVEWCDYVLTVPVMCHLVKALSVTC